MSQYKNQFEIESDLSSEIQFHHFRQEVKIPENQMYELVYHQDQYHSTIAQLIQHGISKIKIQELKYALAYLSEAEKLLEYGASCGKVIDRQLIISTLHNQALCYQKISEQSRAVKYVEAIIFNLKAHIKTIQSTPTASRLTQHEKTKKSAEQISNVYSRKIQLAEYYLVFCSLNSQLGNREQGLQAGKKAIKIYKEYFEELCKSSKNHQILCLGEDKQRLSGIIKNLRIYRNEEEFEKESTDKFIKIAKSSIKKWMQQNKAQKSSETVLDKTMSAYSIASLVELSVLEMDKKQKEQTSHVFTQGKRILKNLANFSMAYFQIATQYRLILEKKYASSTTKQSSKQFKSSLIHYLLSIIFIALYVPYNFLFMKQLIQSFQYHFKIDLAKNIQNGTSSSDILFLFPSVATIVKSRKKSKNVRSISKTTENKINKLKNSQANHHKENPYAASKAEDEYLVASKKMAHSRKRITSNSSKKSMQQAKSSSKKEEKQIQSMTKARINRVRSVTRLNKTPAQQEEINNDFSDYGTKVDIHKTEFDQTKKVSQKGSRSNSTDAYGKHLKGFQQKTLPKRQESLQYPSLYKGFKKSTSNKVAIKKTPAEKKVKKKIESHSKDSKFSVSRASVESTKKKKKVNLNKKEKAKQQTLINYYL